MSSAVPCWKGMMGISGGGGLGGCGFGVTVMVQ